MALSGRTITINYFQENADEIVRDLASHGELVIITVDGEAKAVLRDIKAYKEMIETLDLLANPEIIE